MSSALEIIQRTEDLAKDRSTFENHWQEVARICLTRQDDFFSTKRQGGEKRNQNKYDDTAALALERGAGIVESIITPRSSKWHRLAIDDENLSNNQEVKEWLDRVTDLMFRIRYSPKANYASQQHECYMSLLAFGTSIMIVEDIPGKGIRYKSSHISEHHFVENLHGRIETDYRKYKLTASQAKEKFGEDKLPAAIKTALEKKPSEKFDFIHCVRPNEDYVPGDPNPSKWKYLSFHVAVEGTTLLGTGSFRTFPYIASRYNTAPCEIYGRSPAMTALAEIKMLNAMRKSDIRARHMAVDPPLLAADEATVRRVQWKPRHVNYGALDAQGNQLVKAHDSKYRGDLSNDAIEQSREFINDVFFITLFQILVDSPKMTATEVLQRAQEKGALLSPTMGRQQSEALGPMIERELDILDFAGIFDEGPYQMPDALREAGEEVTIEYTSPLSRLQKSEEALGAQRTLDAAIPLIELEPEIMDKYNLDEYVEIIREANGAPARMFNSDEDIEAKREQRAEQAALASAVEAAPQVSSSIKDIAQAQNLAQ